MHIAYLTPEYPQNVSPVSGGLGTSIKNMAEALVAKAVKVTIILYAQEVEKDFEENGIQFYLIKQKKYKVGGWYWYRKYLEKRISTIIQRDEIDLLEAPDWTGITALISIDVPLVIRINGTDAYFCALENRQQKFKNRFFERRALNRADRVLAVSNYTGRKTMEILNLKRGYEVIPNSISVDNFKAAKIASEGSRILYFGTLIRKKGVLELASILNCIVERISNVEFVFAGRDVVDIFENLSTLELFKRELSEEAAQKFEYLGALNYPEIKKEIEKANVVVLPSFAEALPMTWLEAMAMEKALVTSDIGWAKEVMVDGKTGFTVDPKAHQVYADKIILLLENPGMASEMGKAARQQVKAKFDAEVIVEKNISFYQRVIGEVIVKRGR